MARKKSQQSEINTRLELTEVREAVKGKLEDRVERGKELRLVHIRDQQSLNKARKLFGKWDDFNCELLRRLFSSEEFYDEYSGYVGIPVVRRGEPSLGEKVDKYFEDVDEKNFRLDSILERLELIPENSTITQSPSEQPVRANAPSDSVFIVHGHDEAVKAKVARFVEKLDLKAIILHEQPNKGQTLIEKFESNAANVGFAVILLTPDDIAASKDTPDETSFRARQNVILELGYFNGALGRDRVCVLYSGEVEIPSDYIGVVYTPMDPGDGWHLKLAKEMKEAGLDVDLNKAL